MLYTKSFFFLSITLLVSFLFWLIPSSVLAQAEVIYQIDGMDDVTVRNIEYRSVEGVPFTMDVYYPSDMEEGDPHPVVVFVNGFRDSRISQFIGSDLKDTPVYRSWGRLVAASGLIAVMYESEHSDDLDVLVSYLRDNAASLQIDENRIGIWASSSNTPTAISYTMQEDREFVKVAVFYYGDMITPDNKYRSETNALCMDFGCYASELADIDHLRGGLPTMVVRSGKDNGENPTIDHFVSIALASNIPLTFINFTTGVHSFDTNPSHANDGRAQEIVADTLDFLHSNLLGS